LFLKIKLVAARVPEEVTNVKPIFTGITGTIDLKWKRSKNANAFLVMMSTDPADVSSWTEAAVVATNKATVSGLTSGTRYYFQIIALGTGGPSEGSDLDSQIAA
jgi:hypothetical protein